MLVELKAALAGSAKAGGNEKPKDAAPAAAVRSCEEQRLKTCRELKSMIES